MRSHYFPIHVFSKIHQICLGPTTNELSYTGLSCLLCKRALDIEQDHLIYIPVHRIHTNHIQPFKPEDLPQTPALKQEAQFIYQSGPLCPFDSILPRLYPTRCSTGLTLLAYPLLLTKLLCPEHIQITKKVHTLISHKKKKIPALVKKKKIKPVSSLPTSPDEVFINENYREEPQDRGFKKIISFIKKFKEFI